MSSQKTRLIIGVVAVVVLLGAFGFSKSYNAKKEEQAVLQEETKKLFAQSDAKIKKYIVTQDGVSVTFNKQEDTNWAMEGLENADLTQISIDQAIACLENLEYTQIIENGIDKASDYGLDKGVTDEAYDENGNLVYKITVGNQTVDQTGYYACLENDSNVYIISAENGKPLSRKPTAFRDVYPAYVDFSDIKSLNVSIRDGISYSIVPNPNGEITEGYGEFLLTGIYSFDVPVLSEELADNIGGPFYEITAVDFIDTPEEGVDYGLDNPAMVLSAVDNKGNECTITIGNTCADDSTKVYAQFSGKDYICTVLKEKTDKIKNAKPFDIIGKYFINDSADVFSEITVKDLEFTGTYSIDAENSSVSLNGKSSDMSAFTEIYKSIAAVTMDGEKKKEPGEYVGEIVLTYSTGEVLTLRFLQYDDNYYAVERNGVCEFVTGQRSFTQVFEAVKALAQ